MKRFFLFLAVTLTALDSFAQTRDWVTTWATALQIAEPHNRPPEPGLAANSFRQIVQVSIGGKAIRLHLSNLFNADPTDILGVEIAVARTMGESPEIDESTTVKLTFDGCPFVTMDPGASVVSDPVPFPLEDRMNLAITIQYGRISPTLLTSHPGSRTTSYIADGYTSDFSSPIATTNHWYTISSIDVKPRRKSAAIAVLGDSITDGRGTTTNGQDRWTDQLSRSLLTDPATRNLSVLNFGLGGNCILRGGLGPTGRSRYVRDLFCHPGVKYVILFEGTNDLGGSRDGMATAEGIKKVWAQIVSEAHELGIKVFGATVTPVRGNGYYSPDHEAGRVALNEWIRTSGVFDGVIDFDKMVADPNQPDRLDPAFLYENDWLHLNAAGYEKMGWGIDRNLFK
ncbi:MAG: SGNH/GDSL hydrolase family protein [Bacteroidales bacterium]|nr:SGNH/GDSL hydrolase family protein [Bacteroidales bacterium]